MGSPVERIEFSPHLTAMYIESMRLTSSFCHDNYNITSTEYELLLTLSSAKRGLRVRQLADFLILKNSTIWQMLPSLADRGYIVESSDADDTRFMLLSLSERGHLRIQKCNTELYEFLGGITQKSLPDYEYSQYIQATIRSNLDVLRGHTVDIPLCENIKTELMVDFSIYMRVMIENWRRCIKQFSGLTLNEFRVLQALVDAPLMRVQDIADFLIISRSQASAAKKTLRKKALILEEPNRDDARSLLLTPTPDGREIVKKTLDPLNDMTAEVHRPGTEEGAMVLRAWHSRMYYNLKKYAQANS